MLFFIYTQQICQPIMLQVIKLFLSTKRNRLSKEKCGVASIHSLITKTCRGTKCYW